MMRRAALGNTGSVALLKGGTRRQWWKTLSTTSSMTTTTAHDYPTLFSPLELNDCGITLPNRALMGSMHTGLEGLSIPWFVSPFLKHGKEAQDGSLDRLAVYFQERAQGGVGLMVTGGVSPNKAGWTGPFSSLLDQPKYMERHKVVTQAVHDVQVPIGDGSLNTTTKSRICLQILHTGRYAYHPFCVSASSTKSPISPFKAKALSALQIKQTIFDFVKTAELAQQAGYDGVEIMGSEGYLLSQFLSPRTNLRTDEYGGSLENRARMILEIVRETREAVGNQDFIIIFRLSLLDLVQNGLAFDESLQLAQWLQEAGVSIINTGIGWHEARVPTIATSVPRAAFAFPTAQLKQQLQQKLQQQISVPIVATNRINHPQTAETLLSDGACDLVSMARPFLADPELILKSRTNRTDEINTCIACNQACLDHVFQGKVASCLVNPRACHETELPNTAKATVEEPLLPKEQRISLGVVGAGPAGCAFAIAAAQMGHHVTLYDQDKSIGGQFNMAKRIPGKEEFHETIRYFETMMNKFKVNVQLGTTINFKDDTTTGSKHDKWIIATGVNPRDPKIPGQDHPNVLSYVDVLKHKKPVGKRVAVIGAGGIGFDVSEYLLHFDGKGDKTATETSKEAFWEDWGVDTTLQSRGGLAEIDDDDDDDDDANHANPNNRQIYMLQRKKGKLGAGLGKTTGWIHRATLTNSGAVEMINSAQYDKIDENGYLHITRKLDNNKEETRILEVDTIVICAGQVERRELEEQASSEWKDKVYTIGGAYQAGELDAKRAIDMGTRLAMKIHEADVVPGKHVFKAEAGVEEELFNMLKRFM